MRRAAFVVAVVVVAAAALLGLQLVLSARDDPGIPSSAARGPGVELPDRGHRHTRAPAAAGEQAGGPPASGPHRPEPIRADRTTLDEDQILHALEQGNVVLLYGTAQPPRPLVAVQQAVAFAPFTPGLARDGQAVVLARRAGLRGVVALAWRHRLSTGRAGDPALRDFGEYWLGRGA